MNKFDDFIDYLRRQNVGDAVISWFLAHQPEAYRIVADLAKVNNNAAFGQWKDLAEARIKALGGDIAQTWAATLVHVAYDQYKAGRVNWLKKAFRFIFGWLQRAGLVEFLAQYQGEALRLLQSLFASQSNADLKAVWSQAFLLLKQGKRDVTDTSVALALHVAFSLLKERGLVVTRVGG